MGCLSSKPEAMQHRDPSRRDPSRHYPKDPSVRANSFPPPLPDFAATDTYKVMRMLGEGGSGETWLCEALDTGHQRAVKFILRPIPKVVLPMIVHEVKIQAALGDGHVNLVQAKELILTPTHLGLAMEFIAGGNLTEYVVSRRDVTGLRNGLYCTEHEARYFFKQFLSAVEYLHQNHVAHRDLKLDNIVLDESNPPRIKLCDFGFAKNWDEQSNMFTQIGTPVYMSPQVLGSKNTKKGYDAQKADVWACGVLLFVMLLGMFPFEHSEHPDPNSSDAHVEVWLQQIKCSWRENPRVAEYAVKLSQECRDLLDKIFELDEAQRIDIPGIRSHPWYNIALPEKYETALQELNKDQAQIEHMVQHGTLHAKARDAAIQDLVEQAGELLPGMKTSSSGGGGGGGTQPAADQQAPVATQVAAVQRVWLGTTQPPSDGGAHVDRVSMAVLEEDEDEGKDPSKHASNAAAKALQIAAAAQEVYANGMTGK